METNLYLLNNLYLSNFLEIWKDYKLSLSIFIKIKKNGGFSHGQNF